MQVKPQTDEEKREFLKQNNHDHVIAVYKDCPNKGKPCDCDNTCREVIAYKEKEPYK